MLDPTSRVDPTQMLTGQGNADSNIMRAQPTALCSLASLLHKQCHVEAAFLKKLHHVQQRRVAGDGGQWPQRYIPNAQVARLKVHLQCVCV
eukprot:1143037-Pelagomonas_calceolata.AAC.7